MNITQMLPCDISINLTIFERKGSLCRSNSCADLLLLCVFELTFGVEYNNAYEKFPNRDAHMLEIAVVMTCSLFEESIIF